MVCWCPSFFGVRTTIITSRLSKYCIYLGWLKIHNQKQYRWFLPTKVLFFYVFILSEICHSHFPSNIFSSLAVVAGSLLSFLDIWFWKGEAMRRFTFNPIISWKKMYTSFHYLYSYVRPTIIQVTSCKMVNVACINVILLNFIHFLSRKYYRPGHRGVLSYVFLLAYLSWT